MPICTPSASKPGAQQINEPPPLPHGRLRRRPILDAAEMRRIVRRMAGELIESESRLEDLMLIGIRTRGVTPDAALTRCFEGMLALARELSPGNPESTVVLQSLELNPATVAS